jgi:hypothetical protein
MHDSGILTFDLPSQPKSTESHVFKDVQVTCRGSQACYKETMIVQVVSIFTSHANA